MLHDFNNTLSLEEIEEPEEEISSDTAYLALRTSLSFLEKQPANGTISQQKKELGSSKKVLTKSPPHKIGLFIPIYIALFAK